MTNNIIITQGLVIPPNSKVLICLGTAEWTDEDYDAAKADLKERFPGVEFSFVVGATGVAIMNADFEHIVNQKASEQDNRPHSRACGLRCNGHGPMCSSDCPTCHGKKEEKSIPHYGSREDDLGVEDIAGRTPLGQGHSVAERRP